MPQNAFFLRTRGLLVSQKTTQRHFFSTLHPLSTVNFATAAVLAFVLLRNSRYNFHFYIHREATPTQKSARKCTATSRDFLLERLQSAFTLGNQLRWIAQYGLNLQLDNGGGSSHPCPPLDCIKRWQSDRTCHHPHSLQCDCYTKWKVEWEAQSGMCQWSTSTFENSCGSTALDMPEWRETTV